MIYYLYRNDNTDAYIIPNHEGDDELVQPGAFVFTNRKIHTSGFTRLDNAKTVVNSDAGTDTYTEKLTGATKIGTFSAPIPCNPEGCIYKVLGGEGVSVFCSDDNGATWSVLGSVLIEAETGRISDLPEMLYRIGVINDDYVQPVECMLSLNPIR